MKDSPIIETSSPDNFCLRNITNGILQQILFHLEKVVSFYCKYKCCSHRTEDFL